MQNGDISNDSPKRVIVTLDTVRSESSTVTKRLKIIPVVTTTHEWHRAMLSKFYLFGAKTNFTLEMASFGIDIKDLELISDEMDAQGTNPFRYYSAYNDVNHLVSELPYRPEVFGVIDIPERMLRYGHWGMDYTQL